MRLPSELGLGCAPPAVCKALLPSDRVRRATEVDRGDGIEKKKALARAFPKHDEALRSFFLSLQDTVLVSIGEEGNVIRRWYLVSITAGGHDSKWDKRRSRGDLADFRFFRMHVDNQYRKDFSAFQASNNIMYISCLFYGRLVGQILHILLQIGEDGCGFHANENSATPDVGSCK